MLVASFAIAKVHHSVPFLTVAYGWTRTRDDRRCHGTTLHVHAGATLSLSLRALFTRLLKTSVENGLDKTPAVPNRGQIAPEQS